MKRRRPDVLPAYVAKENSDNALKECAHKNVDSHFTTCGGRLICGDCGATLSED